MCQIYILPEFECAFIRGQVDFFSTLYTCMYIYVSQCGMNVLEIIYTLITETCTGALSESDTRIPL